MISQSNKCANLGPTLPPLVEEEWQAPQSIPGSQQHAYVTTKIQHLGNPLIHPRRAATAKLLVRKAQPSTRATFDEKACSTHEKYILKLDIL